MADETKQPEEQTQTPPAPPESTSGAPPDGAPPAPPAEGAPPAPPPAVEAAPPEPNLEEPATPGPVSILRRGAFFRPHGSYVAVRPIRVDHETVIQPGESVNGAPTILIQMWWRRQWIGLEGTEWVAHQVRVRSKDNEAIAKMMDAVDRARAARRKEVARVAKAAARAGRSAEPPRADGELEIARRDAERRMAEAGQAGIGEAR